jgi:cytochrome b561
MSWKNTAHHYGTVSMLFHWLMFVLLIAVFSTIELRSIFPKGSEPREAIKALHFMLGFLVFILVWLRLGFRYIQNRPFITPALSSKQDFIASVMHGALYTLMIVLPILGWLTVSAAGKELLFFGIEVPNLIAKDKVLANTLEDLHKSIGKIGYYLIGIHTIAALFHHYVQKDNTLMRLLPFNKKT